MCLRVWLTRSVRAAVGGKRGLFATTVVKSGRPPVSWLSRAVKALTIRRILGRRDATSWGQFGFPSGMIWVWSSEGV